MARLAPEKNLIQRKWRAQTEGWNDDSEISCRREIDHIEVARHGSVWRVEQTSWAVDMYFARFEYWFFANNAFAIDRFWVVKRVENIPMTGDELYGIFAVIFNSDLVGKGKMYLVIFEISALKSR